MHRIWQGKSKFPHLIYELPLGRKAFIYASELIVMDEEEERRKEEERKQNSLGRRK